MKLKVMVTKRGGERALGNLNELGPHTSKAVLCALQASNVAIGTDVLSITLIPSDGHDDGPLKRRTVIGRGRLIAAMELTAKWTKAGAAKMLGLTERQVHYAVKHHGIGTKRTGSPPPRRAAPALPDGPAARP